MLFLKATFGYVQEYAEGHPEAAMGSALASLRLGQKIEVKGPFGAFKYQPGKYKAIGGCPYMPALPAACPHAPA